MKLKKWQIALVVVVVIGVIGAVMSGGSDEPTSSQSSNQEEKIEYKKVKLNDMMKELEDNALNAEKNYKDQYVEVTGKLSNIDSSGDYISLDRTDEEFSLLNLQCFVKEDEQLETIGQLKKGDKVTVKGKITDVGEIMGYTLDIDDIHKAK